MYVGAHILQHMCGGQMKTCGGWLAPSITWVNLSGLTANLRMDLKLLVLLPPSLGCRGYERDPLSQPIRSPVLFIFFIIALLIFLCFCTWFYLWNSSRVGQQLAHGRCHLLNSIQINFFQKCKNRKALNPHI